MLAIYSKRDTSILYGTSSSDFGLSTFNSGTGAFEYTAQTMDQNYVLMIEDHGFVIDETTVTQGSSLTMNIRPFLKDRANLAVASTVKRKGQYRVFF